MNLFQLKNDKTEEITAQLEKAIEIAMEAVGTPERLKTPPCN